MSTGPGARGGLKRAPRGAFARWTAKISLALLSSTTMSPVSVYAQEHIAVPAVNLGGSSFMDGIGGPGLLVREALGAFGATRVSAFASTTLLAYTPPLEVLGGHWGVELLVPIVHARLTTPSGSAAVTGIGDLTFSPLVWQAPPLLLVGRQFFQRLDLDVVAPTGQYASHAVLTAGSNVWSVNPYYAFTWLATDRIETSWRIHYLWNSTNNAPGPAYQATNIQPGQVIHVNGAVSIAVVSAFRVGVAGYFLRQITDSQANGHSVSGSQEQVAGLGPGFLVRVGSLQLIANAYAEFAVENRPRGTRANAVVMEVW